MTIFLSILCILLAMAVGGLLNAQLKTNAKHQRDAKARDEWMAALTRSLDGLRGVLDHLQQRPDWASNFCSLAMREFSADGAAMYYHPNGDSKSEVIRVLCTTGVCRDWNLVVGDDTRIIHANDASATKGRIAFEPGVPADFFWSRKPHVYHDDELDPWLPPVLDTPLTSGLVAPIQSDRGNSYLILLRTEGQPKFTSDDQKRLGHCIAIAEAGFSALRAETERSRLERALHSAHEEGMLQISTGIIHNIGNGITVIQIALERLHSGEISSVAELAQFIDREMMPDLIKHLDSGNLQHFLSEDPQGQEYLGALKTLIEQIPKVLDEYNRELDFVVQKFKNVTEIITLQQQFIGELGTENICSFNSIIVDVLKICQQPLEQNKVKLRQSLKANDRILVDTAMMRHILLLLLKFAIEAAAGSRRAKPSVKIETSQGKIENSPDQTVYVLASISDNGAGREIVLNEDDMIADRQSIDEQTRDLFFIKRRVEKYGGIFDVKSEFGIGTRIDIRIPSFDATVAEDGIEGTDGAIPEDDKQDAEPNAGDEPSAKDDDERQP